MSLSLLWAAQPLGIFYVKSEPVGEKTPKKWLWSL